MRIIAGTHRGRFIEPPADQNIRPTSDRIRESLFSILGHRLDGFVGRHVLDACAGTGALGLEALSRGAAWADFMDRDRTALDLCRRNARTLALTDRAGFHLADLANPPRTNRPADLILIDPPYGKGLIATALPALAESGWLGAETLVSIESDRSLPETIPDGFDRLESRDYGRTRIELVSRR